MITFSGATLSDCSCIKCDHPVSTSKTGSGLVVPSDALDLDDRSQILLILNDHPAHSPSPRPSPAYTTTPRSAALHNCSMQDLLCSCYLPPQAHDDASLRQSPSFRTGAFCSSAGTSGILDSFVFSRPSHSPKPNGSSRGDHPRKTVKNRLSNFILRNQSRNSSSTCLRLLDIFSDPFWNRSGPLLNLKLDGLRGCGCTDMEFDGDGENDEDDAWLGYLDEVQELDVGLNRDIDMGNLVIPLISLLSIVDNALTRSFPSTITIEISFLLVHNVNLSLY